MILLRELLLVDVSLPLNEFCNCVDPHLPAKGGEGMEDLTELREAVERLETTLRRVEAHGLALERIVRHQLPVTPEQWNRLVTQAHRQIERGESPT